MENRNFRQTVLSCLPDSHPWRDSIYCYDCVTSTNDLAKELARQSAPGGTVIIAGSQTGGRGRLGRSFHSPPGMGIYLSVILRPDCFPQELMHLTCATAVAVCDAVEAAARFRPGIKWTNDLVYGKRKLSGILTELSLDSSGGKVSYAVIGVGINCRQRPEDFPADIRQVAGSLEMFTSHPIDQGALCAQIMIALEKMERRLWEPGRFREDYRRDCVTLGKDISLCRGEKIRYGKALDIDEQGSLLVEFPDGHRETVTSGEVSVRGMYGYV